jgi:Xaa-Pro aminopeptidase
MNLEFPTLSLKERDRRWAMLRDFMKRSGLECLLVFGVKGREHYEGYVANETIEGMVILPRESDPVLVSWHPKMVMRRIGEKNDQSRFWVKQTRSGRYSETIPAVLRERGLDQRAIGVVGLECGEAGSPEGLVSYLSWSRILQACPKAQFTDVSWPFREMMLEKSPEEIEVLRYCGKVGERAAQAMIATCRPGATEHEIYAAVQYEIHRSGAVPHDPFLIMSWGRDAVGWAEPPWTYSGGAPRRLEPGDVVCAELFPAYGGIETQQQVAVALAPVEPEILALDEVVRASYAAGVKAMRTGNTFAQLEAAMLAPVLAANCWTITPLLHSVAPLAWVGGMAKNLDQVPPAVQPFRHEMDVKMGETPLLLKEGMSFAFEPNACRGQRRVNIGGSAIVRADGAEELNAVCNRLHVIA